MHHKESNELGFKTQERGGVVEVGAQSSPVGNRSLQHGRDCARRGKHGWASEQQVNVARRAAQPPLKGKNFRVDEECQLTRSVLAIS